MDYANIDFTNPNFDHSGWVQTMVPMDHPFANELFGKLCQIYDYGKDIISIETLEQHIKDWYEYDAEVGPTVQEKEGPIRYASVIWLTMTKQDHARFVLKYES